MKHYPLAFHRYYVIAPLRLLFFFFKYLGLEIITYASPNLLETLLRLHCSSPQERRQMLPEFVPSLQRQLQRYDYGVIVPLNLGARL